MTMTKYTRGQMRALLILHEQRGLSMFPYPLSWFLFLSYDNNLPLKKSELATDPSLRAQWIVPITRRQIEMDSI